VHVRQILETKGTDVATVPTSANLTEVARSLTDHHIGALVVSNDGESILGIVSERDLARAVAREGPAALELPVTSAMTAEVRTCSLSDTTDELMEVMTSQRIRHVPVAMNGRLTGIVSIGDVVKHRVAELQEESAALQEYLYSGQ
jgi:signal-transduction protein with cAMP-binding, CBS, and nucleotidyltransferase domain